MDTCQCHMGLKQDYTVVSIERECRHIGQMQTATCSSRIPSIKLQPPEGICTASPTPELLWGDQRWG